MAASRALSITRFLTNPSRVAHALDWRKAKGGRIATMCIRKDSIQLVVAQHPSEKEESTSSSCIPMPLPSIPLETNVINNKRVLSLSVVHEVNRMISDWNICGLVISWPVQKEGWVGAQCGRVMFFLDQLLMHMSPASSSSSSSSLSTGKGPIPVPSSRSSGEGGVFSESCKFCLWNQSHTEFCEDDWGRASLYAVTSDQNVHYASKEQYEVPAPVSAVDVWNDFCRAHWPELYRSSTNDDELPVKAATTTCKSKIDPLHAASNGSSILKPSKLLIKAAFLESYKSREEKRKATA